MIAVFKSFLLPGCSTEVPPAAYTNQIAVARVRLGGGNCMKQQQGPDDRPTGSPTHWLDLTPNNQQPAVNKCFDALTLNASGGRDKVQYSSRNFQFLDSIIRFFRSKTACVQLTFVRRKIYLCLRHHNTSRRDPSGIANNSDNDTSSQTSKCR